MNGDQVNGDQVNGDQVNGDQVNTTLDNGTLGDPSGSALFTSSGPNRWTPTEFARGPWDARHCHGGPVSALLARAVEHADPGGDIDWQVARMTVELTRPVPVGRPLDLITETERPGKRVSLIAARLIDAGTEVAKVRALRIRRSDLLLPDNTIQPPPDPPGTPDDALPVKMPVGVDDPIAYHKDACEHRLTEGSWETPGPVGVWIRLLLEVVPGEPPTGLQRVAAAADFGNGVSGTLPFDQFSYINPDLSVHLIRPPVGHWIGMRAASYYGRGHTSTGAGLAESALYDEEGRLGRSLQSLLIDKY